MKKFYPLIIAVLVIIIICIVVGANNNKTPEKNEGGNQTIEFYVEGPSGEKLEETNLMMFTPGYSYVFKPSTNNYNYEFLPNVADKANDFNYTIDGAHKQFFSELELEKAFKVAKNTKGYLVVTLTEEYNVLTAIQNIYKDKEVVFEDETFETTDKAIFSLVFKDVIEEKKIVVNFGIGLPNVRLELPSEIYF